jgi:hypothetical protein
MSIADLMDYFTKRGFEVHGRCRGKSGACYLAASIRGNWDYGDKECRTFLAANINDPDAEMIHFKFSISRSALATDSVRRLTGDFEHFLLEAGFLRFRRLLREDDTPGRSEEYMLQSGSTESEFAMHNQEELRAEVSRVKREVLDLLWQNRHRGIKRTPKETIDNTVCTSPSVLDSVLDFFEQRKLINGAYGSSGIKITADGEVELERLQNISQESRAEAEKSMVEYDVFISHASEDKDVFVRPLAHALQSAGLKCWYDEFTLKLGDSLRESIDKGLTASRFGLVVLSHHFFSKDWPQRELNGLFAIMKTGERRILPVWHELSAEEVEKYSPILSDLLAANSSEGVEAVVQQVLEVCSPPK